MVKIGDLMSLRNDSAAEVPKRELIVTRTDDGVACLSAWCTHQHNRLTVTKDGSIYCTAHGSSFDLSGKPISGPASTPLTSYLTKVENSGAIMADPAKTVAHGKLAPLPDWAKPKKR